MRNSSKWPAKRRTDEYLRRVNAAETAVSLDQSVTDDQEVGAPVLVSRYAFRPPRKLYRVSEVAEHLGLSRQTIHNYATAGLIAEESHTAGGQRLFGETVFTDLLLIQQLKSTHRLQEIRRILVGRRSTASLPAFVELPAGAASARHLERSQEIASVLHREPPETAPALPPTGAVTSAGSAVSPQTCGNADVGPDFAVRAPSAQPPSPNDPAAADPRHVKETPEDEPHQE
jgi:DNA-binding transcriptional MerR regulator